MRVRRPAMARRQRYVPPLFPPAGRRRTRVGGPHVAEVGPGEVVNQYHLRIQRTLRWLLDFAADIPDDTFLKAAFVDGLRAEFQDRWCRKC